MLITGNVIVREFVLAGKGHKQQGEGSRVLHVKENTTQLLNSKSFDRGTKESVHY